MFSLVTLLSLPVLLSTTIVTFALAAPGGSPQGSDGSDGYIDVDKKEPFLNYAVSLTGGEGCRDKDLKWIRDGFHEMNKLFAAAQSPDFESECEIEFFGRPYRISNYTDIITGNLRRAAQYANLQGDKLRNSDIHIRCDDPADVCGDGSKKDGKHPAYNIGNEPHINFCNRYFDLDPLDEQVNDESGNELSKLALGKYTNRASLWARMVMHISEVGKAIVVKPVLNLQPNATREWTVNMATGAMNTSIISGVVDDYKATPGPNIRTFKYAYGVTRAKLLATLSTQTEYDALNNAENYALYALARYVIQQKGFFPNIPTVNFGNDMAVLTNDQILNGDSKKSACFDMTDVVPHLDRIVVHGERPSSGTTQTLVHSFQTAVCGCAFALLLLFNVLV